MTIAKKTTAKKTVQPKKKLKTRKWDIAEHLKTEDAMARYLAYAFKDGNPKFINLAINDVARAYGMTKIAKKTGMTREGLYKSLSANVQPKFATIQKIVKAFDLNLSVTTKN